MIYEVFQLGLTLVYILIAKMTCSFISYKPGYFEFKGLVLVRGVAAAVERAGAGLLDTGFMLKRSRARARRTVSSSCTFFLPYCSRPGYI